MEFIATLQDQISGPANDGARAVASLRAEVLGLDAALRALPPAARLPKPAGGGGAPPPAAKAPKAPAEPKPKASDDGAKEAEKKKREAEKLAEYMFQVRNRSVAAADKAAADAVKKGEREADQQKKNDEKKVKDKARAEKAKGAETAKAARDSAKEQDKAQKAVQKAYDETYLAKANKSFKSQAAAAISLGAAVAVASAVVGGLVGKARDLGSEFYTLALGPYGAARMVALTAIMGYNFRALFRGIDASPWLKSVQALIPYTTKATVTGRVMSEVFKRTGDDMFAALAKLVPAGLAFAQGILYGALLAENAILKLRIRFAPLEVAIEEAIGSEETLNKVFTAGAGAFGAAAAILGLVAGMTLLAAAAAVKAYDGYMKLAKAFWDVVDASNAAKGAMTFGLAGGAPAAAPKPVAVGSNANVVGGMTAAPAKAAPLGIATGSSFADGLVTGILGKLGLMEAAGGKAAAAVDKGVKDKAEIKSPSRLMRRRGGEMGEGAALGLEDKEARVQAAGAGLVPGQGSGAGGAGVAGGRGMMQVTFAAGSIVIDAAGGAEAGSDLESAIRRGINDAFEAVGLRFGVAVEVMG